MRNFVCILSLFLLGACTYNGFDADEWDGGANELILELSETTISLRNNKDIVDTVFIMTNGESWSFIADPARDWYNVMRRDTMLIVTIDSNYTEFPRVATIDIVAFYNDIQISKSIYIVQPPKLKQDIPHEEEGFNVDEVDYTVELDLEWCRYTNYLPFRIGEGIQDLIFCKFCMGVYDTTAIQVTDVDYMTEIEERRLSIKGFDVDGTISKNIVNDRTADIGFWFSADGTVTTAAEGVLCWDFTSDPEGIDYVETVIYLSPNVPNVDAQYVAYYVFVSEKGEEFVLKLLLNVHKSLPSQTTTVGHFDVEYEIPCRADVKDVKTRISFNEYIWQSEALIGGEVDRYYISWGGVDNDFQWRDGAYCGWWFGTNGGVEPPLEGDKNTMAVCLEPLNDGMFMASSRNITFEFEDLPYCDSLFKTRLYLINSQTRKGVEVVLSIKVRLDEYSMSIDRYTLNYNIPFVQDYQDIDDITTDPIWSDIIEKLGGKADVIYFSDSACYPCLFERSENSGGWFGDDGIALWEKGASFQIGFDGQGKIAVARCHGALLMDEKLPTRARVIIRFVNTDLNLMSDVMLTVNIN